MSMMQSNNAAKIVRTQVKFVIYVNTLCEDIDGPRHFQQRGAFILEPIKQYCTTVDWDCPNDRRQNISECRSQGNTLAKYLVVRRRWVPVRISQINNRCYILTWNFESLSTTSAQSSRNLSKSYSGPRLGRLSKTSRRTTCSGPPAASSCGKYSVVSDDPSLPREQARKLRASRNSLRA
eukprot:scaffold122774_cov48-Prasinocladus_malaysianus.AAC.1